MSTSRNESDRRLTTAGQAGFISALIMMTVQLIWRLNWSQDNVVQAFPEFVVAAVSRLTPLAIFGAATENYGSLAKKSLLLAILIAIAAIGYQGGKIAERLSERLSDKFWGRLASGAIVAASLWLVTCLVILPIAHLGAFARNSSYTSDILIQLTVTAAVYALSWALLTSPVVVPDAETRDLSLDQVDRRDALKRVAYNGAALGGLIAVGISAWKLVTPKSSSVDAVVTRQTADDIIATQRANQGFDDFPQPTPEVIEETARESASLTSDLAIVQDTDPFELFMDLETEDRITPVLTATPDFYNVSKNIVDPSVGSDGWTLKITGLVDNELEFTYDELFARAETQKITTLCCISNELNGSLISTAQWTGIPLKDLLDEAGIQEGAIDLKFHAADDYEDSVSVDVGMDPDNLVVVGMNGETLPEKHGFPARLIIPNIFGMKNVKWLDGIEVVNEDFKGYWQTRGWSDTAVCQIWGRIDFPKGNQDSTELVAAGMAAAGARDISRVEVSLDDGDSWADAVLEPSLNPPFTWVRWAFPFEAPAGEYEMRIRATDGEGTLMTEAEQRPLPDGATGWPDRKFEIQG